MDLKLQNKTAFVSASTAGIGFAVALELTREGARVFVNGRTHRVHDAIVRIRHEVNTAEIDGIDEDLGAAAGSENVVRCLPDILVNNLGIFQAKPFLFARSRRDHRSRCSGRWWSSTGSAISKSKRFNL